MRQTSSKEQRTGADGVIRQIMGSSSRRSLDEKTRTVEFVASDNSVDSYNTVLPVSKWDLSRYNKNGVVGYQHDIYGSDDPDNIIGKGKAFIEDERLIVRITFEPADLNPKAEKVFRKIVIGTLNGVSVGFRATKAGHYGNKANGEDPAVFYYDGQELLEVSVVNVPANANAVAKRFTSRAEALTKARTDAATARARAVLSRQPKSKTDEILDAARAALARQKEKKRI